jgi:tRNA (cmo5U34)-methyltransferase
MRRDTGGASRVVTSPGSADVNLWPSAQHAKEYLERADSIPHRREGEATLLEFLPDQLERFLDLGAGGGRLLGLVKSARPRSECVALDFSPTMLQVLRDNFGKEPGMTIAEHDLNRSLPALGLFDAMVSCFAIHHLQHERKRTLYTEILEVLNPGRLPQSGARGFTKRLVARAVSPLHWLHRRNGRPFEQTARF